MSKVNELRQERSGILVKMEALLEKASTEKRDFTSDEEKEYDGMEKSLDQLDQKIIQEEKTEARQKRVAEERKRLGNPQPVITSLEPDGFRNLGEFFFAITKNPGDQRLQELRVPLELPGLPTVQGGTVPGC